MSKSQNEYAKENERMREMRLAGATFQEIGEAFGVTAKTAWGRLRVWERNRLRQRYRAQPLPPASRVMRTAHDLRGQKD